MSYDPMSPHPSQPPAPSGGGGWKIAVWVIAIVGGLGLLSCCCCGGFGYFALDQAGQQVAGALRSNPIVQEQLGGVDDVSLNLEATGAEGQTGGGQVLVYDVTGPKGTGQVTVQQAPGGFRPIKLRMGGNEWDLSGSDGGASSMEEESEFEGEGSVPADPNANN
jgi:hypothetical protein